MLRAALDYAARGFRVLPLEPKGKNPQASLVRHGSHQATDDPEVLRYWWSKVPTANLGVRCDRLLVIDLDSRHQGEPKWLAMTRGLRVPTCPTQRTPTGGLHLLFQRPAFDCVGKVATGVDVLTGCRYFVAAPSLRAEGRYRWEVPLSVGLPDAPAWLFELVKRPEMAPPATVDIRDDSDSRARRARRYLASMGPAISGSGGQLHTFHAAQVLVRGFVLEPSTAWALLSEWNATCRPPWSERDLRRKLDQAAQHGHMAVGAKLENRRAA